MLYISNISEERYDLFHIRACDCIVFTFLAKKEDISQNQGLARYEKKEKKRKKSRFYLATLVNETRWPGSTINENCLLAFTSTTLTFDTSRRKNVA